MFEYELSKIKDDKIREFTRQALENAPDYFYEVAASSTGKYHSSSSAGAGGLCNHVKGATWIALELLGLEMFNKYSDLEKDIIISAVLLHDLIKYNIKKQRYTVAEHPLLVRKYIDEYHPEIKKIIDEKIYNKIMECIETHSGQWNRDYKSKKEVLPKPKTEIQNFVHLADYLASRKFINFDFK